MISFHFVLSSAFNMQIFVLGWGARELGKERQRNEGS
jgi:hypothetical protein